MTCSICRSVSNVQKPAWIFKNVSSYSPWMHLWLATYDSFRKTITSDVDENDDVGGFNEADEDETTVMIYSHLPVKSDESTRVAPCRLLHSITFHYHQRIFWYSDAISMCIM
ncbi:hypothetical protein HELRODRAFT_169331 [Helobdella robusta]|uniref:Uncharacterized protein n=1 Tax=Helobdella robusta TaxID=6412 RepID=T1F1S8_HELRO|nr:hypothetical protein HELRODRAFT_169331 [Helobdella robusta]ESO08479.1 hypothetical protein HELRODRAFT_169331 [Helobdella robusta]